MILIKMKTKIRTKNLLIIGVLESAERARGPESIFEQIIADNFPNLGRKTAFRSRT